MKKSMRTALERQLQSFRDFAGIFSDILVDVSARVRSEFRESKTEQHVADESALLTSFMVEQGIVDVDVGMAIKNINNIDSFCRAYFHIRIDWNVNLPTPPTIAAFRHVARNAPWLYTEMQRSEEES